MKLTIVIKALNEEQKIAACIESALQVISDFGDDGEVILADSLSEDHTVDIAMKYPIRIVQLTDYKDRSCGAGWQLGYQFAHGQYIWLTDGDMSLEKKFASHAIRYLEENPDVAGVAGILVDTHAQTSAEKRRLDYYAKIKCVTYVDSLGGGGIYKSEAIESVGYISNRWLNAAEEAELGCRLRRQGWKLVRLPIVMVYHTGHIENELGKQVRLFRNKRQHAYGALLRYAWGNNWFPDAIKSAWFIFIVPMLAILALVLCTVLTTHWHVSVFTALLISVVSINVFAFALIALKKRSARHAAVSMLAYHLNTAAAIKGFLERPRDPMTPISAREIKF